MIFSGLDAWSVILALCSVVMLIEGAIIIRSLVVFRRAPWRFIIAVIPLAVGLWSFLVAINAPNVYSMIPSTQLHWALGLYNYAHAIIDGAIRACQIQVGITAAVFALVLLLERVFGVKYAPSLTSQGGHPSPVMMHQYEATRHAREHYRVY